MDVIEPNPTRRFVAVVMERLLLPDNRWLAEQWSARSVEPDTAPADAAGRTIASDETCTRILYSGLPIRLVRDEAEGYLLNVTSPAPKVFVLWRMHDNVARPERVTVSYHEGARWMDSDEKVDGVPLPDELARWIHDFATLHYQPEPKKPKRYASNKDKGRMGRHE